MSYRPIASEVLYIAKQAGKIIMGYYSSDIQVDRKEDKSPVTEADRAANEFIIGELAKLTPHIPIVAEESPAEHNAKAMTSELFWLVDPLDGTRSYIRRVGDFTVNIALVQGNAPVGGAIYVPESQVSYFTAEDGNAYKQDGHNLPNIINVRTTPDAGLVVLTSLRHGDPETKDYLEALNKVDRIVSASSSLKFCTIAEGSADLYPRFGPTMEWDTAAGQAILEAAGGRVENLDGSVFSYRKPEFRNGQFVARGK